MCTSKIGSEPNSEAVSVCRLEGRIEMEPLSQLKSMNSTQVRGEVSKNIENLLELNSTGRRNEHSDQLSS